MRNKRSIDKNFSNWTYKNEDNQSMQLLGSVKLHLNIPICSQQHLQFTVTGELKQAHNSSFLFPRLQHNIFRFEKYSSMHFAGLQGYTDLSHCFLLGCDKM